MSLLLKIPAAVLCCLVLPAYILFFLIFLDNMEMVEFSPPSIPFNEAIPFFILFSLLSLAFWQFSIVRKVTERQSAAIIYLIIVGFNLFMCSFFFLLAAEDPLKELFPATPLA